MDSRLGSQTFALNLACFLNVCLKLSAREAFELVLFFKNTTDVQTHHGNLVSGADLSNFLFIDFLKKLLLKKKTQE